MSKQAIICVDDEKMILESLHAQLDRKFGDKYMLEFAESAEEAQELILSLMDEGIEIEAVISDWLMPGMKGDDFLFWVAKLSVSTKLILLSGHVEEEIIKDLDRSNSQGIRCIYKPWHEENIINHIKGN